MTIRPNAFTFAELFITLLVLGIVAVFTIPKVLTSAVSTEDQAKMRQLYAVLKSVGRQGVAKGTVYGQHTYFLALEKQLGVQKHCTTSAITNGCWPPGFIVFGEQNEGGYVFKNGAMLTGIYTGYNTYGAEGFVIDINGTKGPNTLGGDAFSFVICFEQGATQCLPKASGGWVENDYTGSRMPGTPMPMTTTPEFVAMLNGD